MTSTRSLLAPAVATATLATVLRAVYFSQLHAVPPFLHPVLDAQAHWEWALGLLDGSWPGGEPFFRAPGYVIALAGAIATLGEEPSRIATFQIFAGCLTAVLTSLLAGRIFGRPAAWIAGAGAAAYPMFAFFDGQLLAPSLALPLLLLAAHATLSAWERGTTGWILGAGLLWGAATVTRPPLFLAAVSLPVFFLVAGTTSGRLKRATIAIGALLVLPVVVSLHNVRVGDPAFIATQGGLNFYLGNHREADGMAAAFPDRPTVGGYRMLEVATQMAEAQEERKLRPSEVSRTYWRRGWREVAANPVAWMSLLVKKLQLFWLDREIPNNHDPHLFAESIPVLRHGVGWGFWAPLGVAGFLITRRRRGAGLAAGVVLAVLAANVLFFVNARFRIPAAPFLIVLGSGGLVVAVESVRERGRRGALVWGAAVLAMTAVCGWNPYDVPRDVWVNSYLLVADAEKQRGEPVRALRWVERALDAQPALYAGRMAQIDLLRGMGRLEEARDVAEDCVRLLPADPRSRNELGSLLDLTGDPERALREFETALEIDPVFDPARVSRAVALARLGRREEAIAYLRTFLRERPGSIEAERARAVLTAVEAGEIRPVE